MGLMDKIKNMFTEEVEEQPIKKETIHVEIPSPTREDLSEPETIKREEKVMTPIFFDDKDFATLNKPREILKTIKKEVPYSKPIKEEKKIFKPTPIISPIYGVLDKNYSKDDITQRQEKKTSYYHEKTTVTIDDIRKKAYGTLEDELETTLFGQKSILFKDEPKEDEPEDLFKEMQEETRNENILADLIKDDLANHEPKHEAKETSSNIDNEGLNESDLFDLIDSMYEKGDK